MMIDVEVLEKRSNSYLPLLFLLVGGFIVSLKNILYNLGSIKFNSLFNKNENNYFVFKMKNQLFDTSTNLIHKNDINFMLENKLQSLNSKPKLLEPKVRYYKFILDRLDGKEFILDRLDNKDIIQLRRSKIDKEPESDFSIPSLDSGPLKEKIVLKFKDDFHLDSSSVPTSPSALDNLDSLENINLFSSFNAVDDKFIYSNIFDSINTDYILVIPD